jgi:phenylacetate-CoA ligase
MPISTLGTDVTRFFLDVITMRDHAWHRRSLMEKLAIVRYVPDEKGKYPNAIDIKGWGCVAGEILETGPAKLLHIFSPVTDIAQWLSKEDPNSLLIYPSVANELLRYSNEKKFNLPALHELRTVGEMVTPEVRQACEKTWGAKLVDIYSANEIGYIALQCPEFPHYHIQSENILVEILDESGHPCKAGDAGRVVITTLNNYATPLIRYEIGDLAVAGAECPCGRGLPVIKQIQGRYRNLLTRPDGKRVFPQFGHQKYVAPIRQIQMIQTAQDELTIRLVMPRKMTTKERQEMTTILHGVLGYPFKLTYEYVETLRRSSNGKLEEFISLL